MAMAAHGALRGRALRLAAGALLLAAAYTASDAPGAGAGSCAAGSGPGCGESGGLWAVLAEDERAELWSVLQDEAVSRLDELGKVSDTEGSLTRTYLSPAYLRAVALLARWMRDAGLRTWVDGLGNVHGRLEGTDPSLPALYVGSHFDTVVDAGRFDGTMGVIVPIAAVKALRRSGRAPVRSVELVAWCDEEGVRYGSTFLGSRALAGQFPFHWLDNVDREGITMRQAIVAAGLAEPGGVEEAVKAVAVPRDKVHGYLEVHIEQGPQLEALDTPVGTVLGIAGQTRLMVCVYGVQGHAGTVPMGQRVDALAAAAEAVVAVESRCKDGGGSPDQMLVCTVGEVHIWPGASNVIAGNVNITVDIRSRRDELRDVVVTDVTGAVEALCARRGVRCDVLRKHDAEAVQSDAAMTAKLKAAVKAATAEGGTGGVARDEPAQEPTMVSGAGHDALAVAQLCPISMMFVRCRGGVSHSPLEHVEPADVGFAARATMLYLEQELF